MNLDEIYDLFEWDATYSADEYEARVQKGIAEASKLKNIYAFIQPLVVGKNGKSVWEPCATVVALKSDDNLVYYMHLLLEWLRDMNWPGAEIIFERISQIPIEKIEKDLEFAIRQAEREEDRIWLHVLEALKEHRQW